MIRLLLLIALIAAPGLGLADTGIPAVAVTGSPEEGHTWSVSIQVLLLMTALTVLPSLLLAMTSFTRIIIVLSILRQALGTAQTPPNQVLLGIALVGLVVPTPQHSHVHRDAETVPTMLRQVLRQGDLLRLDFGIFSLHVILTALFLAIPVVLRDLGLEPVQHAWLYLPVMLGSIALMLPLVIIGERRGLMKPVFIGAVGCLMIAQLALGLTVHSFWGFVVALTLAQSAEIHPLTVGVTTFIGQYRVEWQYLFTSSLIAIVPVVILFIVIEKWLVGGLTAGSIK